MTAMLEWRGERHGWLALGLRRTGTPYTLTEQKAFDELAALVARALSLLHV